MRSQHPADRDPRGVYALPFLSRSGHRMLVAVDRHNRFVTRALVFRRDSEEDVIAMMEHILDQYDPDNAIA